MLVRAGLFNLAASAALSEALILSSGFSFLFVEPLLVEEDVKAALFEVNCFFSVPVC